MIKNNLKRFITLLIALSMVLELAPLAAVAVGKLSIAGNSVDLPASEGTVFENSSAEDSQWWLSYKDGEYTLTLNNAKLTGAITSSLDKLTVCVPENTSSSISSTGSCINVTGTLSITGGGMLSLISSATDKTVAVYAGAGLSVSGPEIAATGSSATCIWSNVISIENSTVNVNVKYSGSADCAGILGGRLSISGSKITVSASGGAVARAIYSASGLTISESDVTSKATAVSGGIGIAVQNGLSISGGSVNATASSKTVCAVGIDSWSTGLSLNVASGSITAEGICEDAGRSYAYGIRTHLMYVGGGYITASGTDGGIIAGNNKADCITLSASVGVFEGGSVASAVNGTNYFQTFAENADSLTYLTSGYVTGGASPVVLKSTLSKLTLTGGARTKQQLSAALTPGGATAEYQWYRNATQSSAGGTAISGANSSEYTVTDDDLGKYVYCAATGSDGFEGSVVSKCTAKIGYSLGLPITSVSISGTAKTGCVFTASAEPAGASVKYSWFRSGNPSLNGSAIEGANSADYTLTEEDAGMYVYCAVSGTGDYTGTVYSDIAGTVEAVAQEQAPTLVYVPLDNRTVNTDRVVYEAESAGFDVVMPDEDLYATRLDGQPRNSNGTGYGDGQALLTWIQEMDKSSDYFVLSLDQLLSGGLVNSRVMTNTDLTSEYAVIDALIKLSQNNHVYILDTVARLATCTVGYQGGDLESYTYLRSYNLQAREKLDSSELTVENIIAGYTKDEDGKKLAVDTEYAELVSNALLVRERKLRLTDYMLSHDTQEKISFFIGVDDSGSQSTVQINEKNYIRKLLKKSEALYSGTDELGMMAVVRLMLDYYDTGVKAAAVYFGGTQDCDSGSDYDAETIQKNVERHLTSIGVELTDSKNADIEIVVLTSPAKATMNSKYITQMLDYINNNIASGKPTIVIDPVSGDYGSSLEYRMIQECEVSMLLAYSSWGTAGNAIGLALGNGISRYLYLQSRTTSSDKADKAYLKGLVFSLEKDISYLKAGGKTLFTEYLTGNGWDSSNFYVSDSQAATVCAKLETILKTSEYNVTVNDIVNSLKNKRYIKGLDGECGVIESITQSNYSCPFYRTNEIRFDIDIGLSDITLTGFDDSVTVTLPYTPSNGELVYDLSIYYKDESGNVQELPCEYDPAAGRVVFTVTDPSGLFLSNMSILSDEAQGLYTDVASDSWYYRNVLYVSEKGLMTGTSENTFNPEAYMTRAMFLSVLYRIASPDISNVIKSPFSDVLEGDWYYDASLWAYENGIVTGHTNGSLGAKENITRQEAAVLIYRLAAYLKANLSVSGNTLSDFKDGASVSAYAGTALSWAVEQAIISGMSNNTLSPTGTVTRAQAAAMLQRLCEVLNCDN